MTIVPKSAGSKVPPSRLLSEPKGKALLRKHGIVVPEGALAESAAEAVAVAERIGYPVVAKIVSPAVSHKSDVGGVLIGLRTPDEVRSAFQQLVSGIPQVVPGATIDGVLIEQQVPTGVELIVGIVTDPQFGHVLIVGLGGVLVDLYEDVAIRCIPVTDVDVRDMLGSLKGARLLTGYRGQPPIDMAAIVDLILKIGGRGGLAEQLGRQLVELDLNPVVLAPNGAVVLDARFVVQEQLTADSRDVDSSTPARHLAATPDQLAAFQAMFYPRSIAMVGASSDETKAGARALRNLINFGYAGDIYPINPKADEIYGRKAYPSVMAVPGDIDRAYITVPAKAVLDVIDECAAKGVKVAQIYTSGFAEVGGEGRALEADLVARARRGGVRIVGPNCAGTYVPKSRLTWTILSPEEVGEVSFISQSGGLAQDVIRRGKMQGLRFSKVIAVGNLADLDHPDYLEYLRHDPETRVIAHYIDSVKDAPRFFRALQATTPDKPVVILKGGQTSQGTQAVSTHSGGLAGDYRVWQGVMRQAGVTPVTSVEELIDTLTAFQFLTPPRGRRVALIGNGGGATVTASDECDRLGLQLPGLSKDIVAKIDALGIDAGSSIGNPIDAPIGVLQKDGGRILEQMLRHVTLSGEVDAVVVHLNLVTISVMTASLETVQLYLNNMVGSVLALARSDVPVLLALRSSGEPELEPLFASARDRAIAAGVPVYPSINTALNSIAKLNQYHEYLMRLGAWNRSDVR